MTVLKPDCSVGLVLQLQLVDVLVDRLLMSVSAQVANDVDGSGNYLLLTHRHVAHLHPFSSYLCRRPRPSPPSWVLYHKFTISHDNSVCVASEVHPQM